MILSITSLKKIPIYRAKNTNVLVIIKLQFAIYNEKKGIFKNINNDIL